MKKASILTLLAALALAGCSGNKVGETVIDPKQGGGTPQGNSASYSFSKEAREVAQLIDDKKFIAAEKLLNAYVPDHPNDAGIYAQYARYLMASDVIASNPFLANPIRTDDKYKRTYLIADSMATAAELDEASRPYLAEETCRIIYNKMKEEIDANNGFMTDMTISNYVYGSGTPGLESLIWEAIKLDKERVMEWAPRFEDCIADFARLGKISSAMMLGNLVGDMKTGADPLGDEDFRLATTSFVRALQAGTATKEDTESCRSMYNSLFKSEVEAGGSRAGEAFQELQTALDRTGYFTTSYSGN